MENINLKKSRSTFLGVRILAVIPVYLYEKPARYLTDIKFLFTVWYQVMVQTKMIIQRLLDLNESFTNEETYRGIRSKISSISKQEICQFCQFSL